MSRLGLNTHNASTRIGSTEEQAFDNVKMPACSMREVTGTVTAYINQTTQGPLFSLAAILAKLIREHPIPSLRNNGWVFVVDIRVMFYLQKTALSTGTGGEYDFYLFPPF